MDISHTGVIGCRRLDVVGISRTVGIQTIREGRRRRRGGPDQPFRPNRSIVVVVVVARVFRIHSQGRVSGLEEIITQRMQ
jgi:hypothetical protein